MHKSLFVSSKPILKLNPCIISEPLKILEKEVQNHIETDKNKYVVRVLNHGLNLLNGTSKKVK